MEKIIVNEEDIPKTYLNGVWEKEIYIDEENLCLHPGMDQPGYKTYTYIDTAQTQWQKENPKKITCSSLSNLVEGLIDKDIQLVKIPYENSEKLFYDTIEFSIPVLNKFGKTKISRINYLQIKSLIESTTSFLFNTKEQAEEIKEKLLKLGYQLVYMRTVI